MTTNSVSKLHPNADLIMRLMYVVGNPSAWPECYNPSISDLIREAVAALSHPQGTGSREAVAWLHNLTGVIRQDKPAASMGLHEDYTHLFTLSQLQAVERENVKLREDCESYKQASVTHFLNKTTVERELKTAEASLAAAREALKRAEYVPGDHPVVPIKIATMMIELRAALAGSNGE